MNKLRISETSLIKIRRYHSFKIQEQMISESIELSKGNASENTIYTTYYKFKNYELKLGKPGKEYSRDDIKYKDGHKSNNPNDCTPTMFKNGRKLNVLYTFDDIFKIILKFKDEYKFLEILGAILVRMALVLDHKKNSHGNYRYYPNEDIINNINSISKIHLDIPLECFLCYLELIALNEDTKYTTTGHTIKGGIGRYNNIMTYVHLIKVFLKRKKSQDDFLFDFMSFSGNLTRIPTGLSPLSFPKALKSFPLLLKV